MLNFQDIQFHPAWRRNRYTTGDLVREFGLGAFSAAQLAMLGKAYLDFSGGDLEDWALWRGIECLEAAADRGSEMARDLLQWVEDAL
jgi:hypothetical protein